MKKLLFVFSYIVFTIQLTAQLSEAKMDALITSAMEEFNVPGISVGVIENGKVTYAKGHGIRSMWNNKPMEAKTLVGVASNSKGFTCFALAMMVDAGKLNWDDKVRKYIPEFQLSDPWITEQFTVRDLVTHRSGLPLGAGDLMFFPDGNDFTVKDVIAGIKHLKPETSFRTTYRYNNNMFIIGGEVLKRVSGLSWEDFIEQKIMQPVGMKNSKASFSRLDKNVNRIDAHTSIDDGSVVAIPHDWSNTANPAGGIMSNIDDMLIWSEFLMNNAVTQSGKRLLSEEQMHELWQLQTPIKVRKNDPYSTRFKGYGLGWFVSDVGGFKEVTHTGGLLGTVTQLIMFPEKKLGIVVLTNQMSGAAFMAISNSIKDSYLGYGDRKWVSKYGERMSNYFKNVDQRQAEVYTQVDSLKSVNCHPSVENIVGTYTDKWFGEIVISHDGEDYIIQSIRSPRLFGKMYFYGSNTFVVKWNDRSYDADVFMTFDMDTDGKAQKAKMEYISSITDFSFDFHDLDFSRKMEK